ncbi:MAG: tRNA (adenosine(37)-N6)-threonylcarbamoyltransferase complex transferase subunit TsaD [Eubacteriaceae bacterium]|jgi:N6-L-threonylcarbamoyladenine synthase|nr:tRNA (adenosine(37)-N6)-threonylcarbamoyltransferase complex transferase subunit TsaD [Eubacteriaceae bacterium]
MTTVKILAIETSCDETAAAVSANEAILSNIVRTQVDIHAAYGGVVPEIASRSHLEALPAVIDMALSEAGESFETLDAIAVTYGPGLIGALLAGLSYAKSLAFALGIKLIGVNHLVGHISAGFLCGARPPLICLIASGGHTKIVLVKGYTSFEVLGRTVDDAAGEALDKVARSLGLGYPGGPKLDELAGYGDSSAITFPRPKLSEENFDFSFSGLKSAVLNYLNISQMRGSVIVREDVGASFRRAVVDVLVEKTMRAARLHSVRHILICGGVSRSVLLRNEFSRRCHETGYILTIPSVELCSDNAAMIAASAYRQYLAGDFAEMGLNADPSLDL